MTCVRMYTPFSLFLAVASSVRTTNTRREPHADVHDDILYFASVVAATLLHHYTASSGVLCFETHEFRSHTQPLNFGETLDLQTLAAQDKERHRH